MFSGLVREIALVRDYSNHILRLSCSYVPAIGDSIAVNGMCLTVIALHSDGFSLEISAHSASQVAIENYTNKVHIEPALRADSRLDGHFVQGHIDAIGEILAIEPCENQTRFIITAPSQTLPLCIPQGSITIDGISLTISSVQQECFTLTIIPHTFENTLFSTYRIGRRVNIETDVIVRSLAHIVRTLSSTKSSHALDFGTLDSRLTNQNPSRVPTSWREFDDIAMRF